MIGQKIKELRKRNKLTQKELSEKIDVKQPHLNRWENGARNPSIDTLKKIAKIFDISLDLLVFEDSDIIKINGKDKTPLSQLKQFEKLNKQEQQTVLNLINTLATR